MLSSVFVVLAVAPSQGIPADDVSCCNCNDFLTLLKKASSFPERAANCGVTDCNEDFDVVSSGLLALTSDGVGFISLEAGVDVWDASNYCSNDGTIGRILLAQFYIL